MWSYSWICKTCIFVDTCLIIDIPNASIFHVHRFNVNVNPVYSLRTYYYNLWEPTLFDTCRTSPVRFVSENKFAWNLDSKNVIANSLFEYLNHCPVSFPMVIVDHFCYVRSNISSNCNSGKFNVTSLWMSPDQIGGGGANFHNSSAMRQCDSPNTEHVISLISICVMKILVEMYKIVCQVKIVYHI